jgi:Ras-related protein Rab-8A
MGILLVYDVTDESSFTNVRNWMKQIDSNAAENVNRILIGNKCDVEEGRVITYEQGSALAEEFGINFFETSAKQNTNVEKAFQSIARDIVERLKENPEHYGSEGGVSLDKGKSRGRAAPAKGCC